MVDPESVLQRLARLDRVMGLLDEVRGRGEDAFLGDVHLQLETERALQVAIQICIDIGAHLVSDRGMAPPDDYRGVFASLAEGGVIEAGLSERLADAAGLRNLLVHGYADIDHHRLWSALSGLDDLRRFAAIAAAAASQPGPR